MHFVPSRLALSLALCLLAPLAHAALEAGVATVDITPQTPQRMSGYFSERISTGTHDPLMAKAVYFRQDDIEAAFIVCDAIGVSEEITARIRDAVETATGIPAHHIAVAATHTHTGPLYYGVFRDLFHEQAIETHGEDPYDPAPFVDFMIEQIAEAVVAAKVGATPVSLRHGSAEQHGLSFNRRFYLRDGTVRFNPGKMNPDIVGPAGPIDPEVPMLMLATPEEGNPALIYTFALHLDTVGGTEFGGDYPAVVQRLLRDEGRGLVTVFGIAPCGDINHIDVRHGDAQKGHEEAGRIGEALAATLLEALPTLRESSIPALAVARTVVEAPRQEYDAAELEWARETLANVKDDSIPFLDKVRARAVVDLDTRYREVVPLEVQVIRLSREVALVFLPGEILIDLGLHLKNASPFETTLIFTLANDAPGYIPSTIAFEEGSYETVNSRIQPGGGEALIEATRKLLFDLMLE